MNAVIKPQDHYAAEFERMAADVAGNQADWLRELRSAAIARFSDHGFPGPRDENWKYSRTTAVEKRAFRCEPVQGAVDVDGLRDLLGIESGAQCLVFVDGRYFPSLSRVDALPGGVILTGLNEQLQSDPEALRGLFGEVAVMERHPFAALNTAFATDGVYLAVADNVIVEQSIHIVFIATQACEGHASHPRILVNIGNNAQASLVERYVAVEDSAHPKGYEYFTNVIAEIKLGDNAGLDHSRVQEESAKSFHVSGVHVHQSRDSRYDAHGVSFGNALLRNDIDVQLAATGAHCGLTGLYLANGRQHVDVHTRIDHLQPHGSSDEFYKGILDGHGRGVFNGKVLVHPDAQKTDARQSNQNLLLSADAEADTKPELEIYADDVKCSHGATVGQLDADAVFYLRSRGVDEAMARHLLTHAFAAEIIDRAKSETLRNYLDAAVMARLPKEVTA